VKAAVYHGPKNIKIENAPEPVVKGRKVLVKFKAGSICGTDLHLYRGDWQIKKGRIIGHDACGVREDTGERVVMVPLTYCGECYFCLRGHPSLCDKVKYFGLTRGGFFAESIALRPKNLIPLPESVSNEEGAIMEPVALALHTLDMLDPKANDWATVVGQGPIGLLMTQIAKLKGCRVIAIDVEEYRLEIAKKYGADECINAANEDAAKRVMKVTRRGSDVVVESAGTKKTVEQTPFLVRKGGRVALVGEFEGYLNLNTADEAMFFTTYISPIEYPTAVDLVARKQVDVKGLITHRFKLADFEKALETAENKAEKPFKVVITA
jgi:threonine dehydrogenase-like Zn-dependent dehydrogenase